MAWEELGRDADRENMRTRDKLIGVYVGILAVVLAICILGGSNAQQDATQQNIAASNVWSFFQAKNARRQALRLHAYEFDVMLKATPSMPDDVKKPTTRFRISSSRPIPNTVKGWTSFSPKARLSKLRAIWR